MIVIDDTLAFLRRWLPPPPRRLLEIGAGAGELTEALQAIGYTVAALDSDATAVVAAQVRGLPVHLASWPTAVPMDFDAVLLVRTLHHLDDLDDALVAVRTTLAPDGLVLVDDFAIADLPASTVNWLRPWVAQALAAELLRPTPHPMVHHLLSEVSTPTFVRDDHEVHTAGAMERALREHFTVVAATSAPYLYRYLAASLQDEPRAIALVRDAVAAEQASIDNGTVWPLGRRWVAKATEHNAYLRGGS